jgi:hypothetical protein
VAFLKTHAVRSPVVADGIIGCPHEEGVDYPEGKYCPQCPGFSERAWTISASILPRTTGGRSADQPKTHQICALVVRRSPAGQKEHYKMLARVRGQ